MGGVIPAPVEGVIPAPVEGVPPSPPLPHSTTATPVVRPGEVPVPVPASSDLPLTNTV